ncbi:MAG TPA: hypothetical protein PLT42_08400 [Sphaerochaeta sp.]|jgi:glycerol kinase|nr:hypothetical protein [Sphaerochaeta sp.]
MASNWRTGNVNYSGATISYLVDELGLFDSVKEVAEAAKDAKEIEGLYLVSAPPTGTPAHVA